MILVSVIIPCFNATNYIEKSLRSITEQTYNKLEIILVDDGSKEPLELVLPEQFKLDDRIKIVTHDENSGLSNARNTGHETSQGDYVLFWDADDILGKNTIETLVRLATSNNSELVRGVLARSEDEKRWVTKRGRKLLQNKEKTDFENSPELVMDFTSCGVLFLKSFLKQHELRFEPNLYMQDILFTSRSLICAKNICMTDCIVGDYIQSSQSASRLRTEKRFNSLFELHEKLENEFIKHNVSDKQRNAIRAGFINAGVNTFLHWKLEEYETVIGDLNRLSNLLDQLGSEAINQYCMDMLDEPSYLRLHATRVQNYPLAISASSTPSVSEKNLNDLLGEENLQTKKSANDFLNNLRAAREQSSSNGRLVLKRNETSSRILNLIGKVLSRFKSG